MKRTQLIQNIRDAKEAHVQWVHRAKHLISGLPIDNDMIPLDPTVCTFGHWLYNEGHKYKAFTNLSNQIDELETVHANLHKVYIDIYKIYFLKKKRNFLSNLFFRKEKIRLYKEKNDATYAYYELEHISEALILGLTKFEQSIKTMDDEVINTCAA